MADAARVTCIALQAGGSQNTSTHSECDYDRADSPDAIAVINVTVDTDAHQPTQYDFDLSHPLGGGANVDAPGLGDKAFYMPGINMLVMLKGNNLFHISITDYHVTDPKTAILAAAPIVLGNLH